MPPPSERFADIPDPVGNLAAPALPPPPVFTEPSATRDQRKLRTSAGVALAVAWPLVISLLYGLRPDLGTSTWIAPFALITLGAALALLLALRPGARGLPAGIRTVQVLTICALLTFAAAAMLISRADDGTTSAPIGPCFAVTVLMAVGPLATGAALLQGTFLSAAAWRGALVGAVAGLCGAGGIHLHCNAIASAHVFIAHGSPILLATLLGAALGALRGRA